MTKEQPFSAAFDLEKETENTVRSAEEAEGCGENSVHRQNTSFSTPHRFA